MNQRKILAGAAALALLVVVLGGVLHRDPKPAKVILRGNMGGQIGGGFVPPTKMGSGGGGTGDITDVVAGLGLTGGASSGAATVDVGCGTGLSCAADTVSIADGDRGDVSITGSGATWDVDPGAVGTTEIADNLDLSANGSTTVGDLRVTTQSDTLTGTVNDQTLNSTTSVWNVGHAGAVTLTGLTGGADGRIVFVYNDSAALFSLTNESAGSTATNRFALPQIQTVTINRNGGVMLRYSSTLARWVVIAANTQAFYTVSVASTITATTGLATINTATIGFTSTAQTTTGIGPISATNTGTFNTTAGALESRGITISNTATRSAGANPLTNAALRSSASGAQTNYAAIFGAGNVVLDTASAGVVDLSTAPTFTACGTSPTATTGGAYATTITMGSGAPTTCALTFSTTYANAPTCQVTSRSSARQDVYLSAVGTTGVTISNVAAATMASIVVDLICVGH